MDLYGLYGFLRTGFLYQELDFHRATLVLRYKGLRFFSPDFRLFFRLYAFYDFSGADGFCNS